MYLVFDTFSNNLLIFSHLYTLSISEFIFVCVLWQVIVHIGIFKVVSSAKRIKFKMFDAELMSFIKMINKSGPRIEP